VVRGQAFLLELKQAVSAATGHDAESREEFQAGIASFIGTEEARFAALREAPTADNGKRYVRSVANTLFICGRVRLACSCCCRNTPMCRRRCARARAPEVVFRRNCPPSPTPPPPSPPTQNPLVQTSAAR